MFASEKLHAQRRQAAYGRAEQQRKLAQETLEVFGEKDPELTATVAGTLGEDTVKYDVVREAGEKIITLYDKEEDAE